MPSRQLTLRGSWASGLAGGCPKNETFASNPQYVLTPSSPNATFTLELSQPSASGPACLPIGLIVLNWSPGAPLKHPISSRAVAKSLFSESKP